MEALLLRHPTERTDVLRAPGRASLPDGEAEPSEWIKDQPWYLFLWRHDPTIQSMLVMIDAIHERFRGRRCRHGVGEVDRRRRSGDLVPAPPAVRIGVGCRRGHEARGPLHQDELTREAPHRVRELQGALREDDPVVASVRGVRTQGGHHVVGPPVAPPGRRRPHRRRVPALHGVRHRDVRVA